MEISAGGASITTDKRVQHSSWVSVYLAISLLVLSFGRLIVWFLESAIMADDQRRTGEEEPLLGEPGDASQEQGKPLYYNFVLGKLS